MWIWGTIFGLGRDVSRYAMRGLGCVFALIVLVALLAGLGSSMIASHPEKAAAVAMGAVSIDGDASLRDNARYAAESYRDTHRMLSGSNQSGRGYGDVAADWERDRKDAEAEEADRYGEY